MNNRKFDMNIAMIEGKLRRPFVKTHGGDWLGQIEVFERIGMAAKPNNTWFSVFAHSPADIESVGTLNLGDNILVIGAVSTHRAVYWNPETQKDVERVSLSVYARRIITNVYEIEYFKSQFNDILALDY